MSAPSTISVPLYDALQELATLVADVVPREGAALLAVLGRSHPWTLDELPALLAAMVAARSALLASAGEEAAALWEDLLATSRALRVPLFTALRDAPDAGRERWLAHLQAQVASGSPGLAAVEPILSDPMLTVAVAGDFKRGKSTLLNALLGRRLLPTRVAPATAVPCSIRYGPELTVRVLFRDGRRLEEVAAADLERYACIPRPGEEDPVAFRSDVARVQIELPWALPRDVALLDLPGLNEEQGRAELARVELARADAVLVVLAATQLLAEDELEFLDTLWGQGHRALLFAVNYIDQVDEADHDLVRERAAILLEPYGGALERTAFLVSARQALLARAGGESAPLESGVPALEAALQVMLTTGRAALRQHSRLRQSLHLLEDAEEATGRAVLTQQAVVRRRQTELAALEAQLAGATSSYAEREAALALDLDLRRQRLADHQRVYEERWAALEAELHDRCRKEPLTWVWQHGGNWLRDEMIRAIRDVYPQVTPRPEGHLRISVAPGLRLGREALFAFYRAEAAREWERFTGQARRAGSSVLEEALAEGEREQRRVEDERQATCIPLEARRVELQTALGACLDEVTRLRSQAQAAVETLHAALSLPSS